MTLESGKYEPADLTETVTVWPLVKDADGNEGPDFENIPDGFIDEETSAGEDYFVLTDGTKRNRPVRDSNGNAVILLPGGAVVEKSNGVKYTLAPDELDAYAETHTLKKDAPASTPSTPSPSPTQSTPSQPSDSSNSSRPSQSQSQPSQPSQQSQPSQPQPSQSDTAPAEPSNSGGTPASAPAEPSTAPSAPTPTQGG